MGSIYTNKQPCCSWEKEGITISCSSTTFLAPREGLACIYISNFGGMKTQTAKIKEKEKEKEIKPGISLSFFHVPKKIAAVRISLSAPDELTTHFFFSPSYLSPLLGYIRIGLSVICGN